MTSDQAVFLRDVVLGQWAREAPVTRKVIAAVPEANGAWRPDPKSMTGMELAYHLATAEQFFLSGVLNGKFEAGDPSMPAGTSLAAILEIYDNAVPALINQIKSLPAEKLTGEIDFFGMFSSTGVGYLQLMLSHSIHHRGQLSSYLRPMGGKVPSIYGPSADEPLKASA